jgi:hypothetical protein
MASDIYNEGSTFSMEVGFESRPGAQTTPSTVHYQLKDLSNDRTIRDWTEVTPGAVVTISITADENEVYHDSRRRQFLETRALVVAANKDTSLQFVDEYYYLIRNLRGYNG